MQHICPIQGGEHMQYTIHHACGHEETVVLYGPTKDRERRIAAMEAEDCPSCRAADAHMNGCVDLVGSDKQVAWAGQIRRSFLPAWERDLQTAEQNLDEQLPKAQEQIAEMRAAGQDVKAQEQRLELVLDAADQCHAFVAALHREASASWWIENRHFAERDGRGHCLTDYFRLNGKSPVGLMMRDELKRDEERPRRKGVSHGENHEEN